jgi:hypothetical protein
MSSTRLLSDEAIENWFTDLQAYEAQLDALASASMDQNFTDELQAIESCEFRGRTPTLNLCPHGLADYCQRLSQGLESCPRTSELPLFTLSCNNPLPLK